MPSVPRQGDLFMRAAEAEQVGDLSSCRSVAFPSFARVLDLLRS
jgi:hypothetical protein